MRPTVEESVISDGLWSIHATSETIHFYIDCNCGVKSPFHIFFIIIIYDCDRHPSHLTDWPSDDQSVDDDFRQPWAVEKEESFKNKTNNHKKKL